VLQLNFCCSTCLNTGGAAVKEGISGNPGTLFWWQFLLRLNVSALAQEKECWDKYQQAQEVTPNSHKYLL
jgi:hypothetical protein